VAEGRRIIVKKKGGGHAHHGGAWKVAYADFVTAMMALFMVMWLLASTDEQSRQEISRYFRTGILPDGDMAMERAAQSRPSVIEEVSAPPPKNKKGGPSEKIEEEARQLGKAVEQMFKADPELSDLAAQVSISVTEEGLLIEAVDRDGQSMLFDLSSSELKPGLIAFLDKLGPMLAQRGRKLRIMGHTDARPFISRSGKGKTNWDLSYERATNARKVLESSGIARGQIVSVQAHGPSQLRNPADPYAAENRRLSVLVLHDPEPPAEATPGMAPAPAAGAPATPPAEAPAPAAPPDPSAPAGATIEASAGPAAPPGEPASPGAAHE
jgi:chemotaxis protein MotB